ncbi:CocE/NonD family hydrolase [Bacillus sp. B15-48]|uniref:CocE/NonD family hydrolase n=1 Tax=Bacillus sp. B15-48 TaxID=1548601 RepID=UPI00193F3A15|nr:CocE/NonD family hydrolase [Bacillus sp. B15-48]MBM4763564.1 CocE/NonD family hydrolase [Bacillus sp. B15-48]
MEIQQIIVEKNVPCKMRDGVTLYADIYRPNSSGTFPVLLTRLPYNKDLPFYSHRYLDTNRLVQNGFVVIIQDVRGRFNSEGDFYPFIYEAEDGYDTVEWAAGLPYANGKVGMFGLSYYGFTQLLAATEQPPHLQAIFPAMTLTDWHNDSVENDGKYLIGGAETWALESVAPDELKRKHPDPDDYHKMMKKMAKYYDQMEEWFNYMPVENWPPLKELGVAEYFFDFIKKRLTAEQIKQMSIRDKYSQITVPAYHLAGWYDNFLKATIRNFSQLRNKEDAKLQKLMIGPWAHGIFQARLGERNFGLHASQDWIDYKEDLTALHIRWFNHWLKEEKSDFETEAPIKLFVMGINEWRDEYEWPLARTNYTPYYLDSEGHANTRFGDGKLTATPSSGEHTDHFLFDPANPVPSNGGGTLFAGGVPGPLDQREIEEREDVLVYTSEPLIEPLEVTGEIKVKIWVKTDAVDTDFTAKLVDVDLDGKAIQLADGIKRIRSGNENQLAEIEIDLWATSNVFLPGHCIRLEVSSSNFPRYDVNLNTGESMITSSERKVAKQTVYHQSEYPSQLLLPVIDNSGRKTT